MTAKRQLQILRECEQRVIDNRGSLPITDPIIAQAKRLVDRYTRLIERQS